MSRVNKEKYFKETRAYRNCNPLNIRATKARWQGQIGQDDKGFVKFISFDKGYRAAMRIFRSYRLAGLRTIREIIERWAPPEENDTEKYISTVVQYMNAKQDKEKITPDSVIELKDRDLMPLLMLGMTRVEMGANASQLDELSSFAEIGWDMAVTDPDYFTGITRRYR